MTDTTQLRVPDLGDFEDVEIIEILAAIGDIIAVDDPLITIETDKASMDIPAEIAGKIVALDVEVGGKVSSGSIIAEVELAEISEQCEQSEQKKPAATKSKETPINQPIGDATHSAKLLVIGSGPGGYTAAFRAADLGVDVIMVEKWPVIGGVCLNVGCIPSKAYLHAAKVIDDAEAMADHGVTFDKPKINSKKLRDWKNGIIRKLTGGLQTMAKQRKVKVVNGLAKFESANRVVLDTGETIDFEYCIIAAGSKPTMLPGLPDDPRIVDSTGALELTSIPKKMLVVGGGIIGLEMACVYAALGARVSVVELADNLMPGTDPDLLRPFMKIIKKRYESIMVSTKVTGINATKSGIEVSFEGNNAPQTALYDRVLIAIGRKANGNLLDADKAGVSVDEFGIINVDKQMRTNIKHIFAIGDLAGGPMLAHKASHEAKVAAEVIAGEKSYFDARAIPSVAYTDPEIAWVGLTELEAKAKNIDYEKAQFPWAASGRALAIDRPEGFTKLLFDKKTSRILGGAIVGQNAGDLISEIGFAIEMGSDASDISLTIHPHPTLSETIAFSSEAYEGTLTDLYIPKKKSS
ncbi:MAG: dihydrolipoyl dehydrogenase [Gammaproteobacteria bacterium]|nr:dihydrolipoyl dehydrogenase [Gammaproteobacteria bacterium]